MEPCLQYARYLAPRLALFGRQTGSPFFFACKLLQLASARIPAAPPSLEAIHIYAGYH